MVPEAHATLARLGAIDHVQHLDIHCHEAERLEPLQACGWLRSGAPQSRLVSILVR